MIASFPPSRLFAVVSPLFLFFLLPDHPRTSLLPTRKASGAYFDRRASAIRYLWHLSSRHLARLFLPSPNRPDIKLVAPRPRACRRFGSHRIARRRMPPAIVPHRSWQPPPLINSATRSEQSGNRMTSHDTSHTVNNTASFRHHRLTTANGVHAHLHQLFRPWDYGRFRGKGAPTSRELALSSFPPRTSIPS